MTEDIDFRVKQDIEKKIDTLITPRKAVDKKNSEDRIRIANEIKTNPPEPGFMRVDIRPAIYSIDLNVDAHWWFNHVCTVFPLLLDQGIRTHVDIKDSFKPEKRFPDFNFMWIIVLLAGIIGIFVIAKFVFNAF
jgi:hypothetical protein